MFLTGMELYSTTLWHLQKEVALSALAQDLVETERVCPEVSSDHHFGRRGVEQALDHGFTMTPFPKLHEHAEVPINYTPG